MENVIERENEKEKWGREWDRISEDWRRLNGRKRRNRRENTGLCRQDKSGRRRDAYVNRAR